MIEKQLNDAFSRGDIVIKELEYLQPQPYTFEEAYKEWWMFYSNQELTQATKDKTRAYFNGHLLKTELFVNLRLDRINRLDIQKKVNIFLPKLTQSKAMLGYASRVFKYAVDSEHIICDSNPLEHIQMVRPKRTKRREVRFYDEIQAKMFEVGLNEYFKNDVDFLTYFITLLRTGMRKGEALGLKWSSVDFERREILLNGRISMDGNGKGHYLKGLKNGDDFRYIDIDDVVIDKLKKWHYVQAQRSMLKGKPINNDSFVFKTLKYSPFHQLKEFNEWYNNNHSTILPYLNIHGLRHTHASLLISSGMGI
ncbi:site-specific integrase [Weissella koreensis]|uniref:site-specific integrase n=1 Tax=Weissella koreensis TaxID=165096 RepID=UPI000CF32BEF|nr:site-specific integrase [Weissella koreensis]AVH75021.1 site-specific integrase [Weissella koreensis]QGN20247.1 tyrosine-type recombinase/integrase [Weissella koreensis]